MGGARATRLAIIIIIIISSRNFVTRVTYILYTIELYFIWMCME